MQGRVHRHCLVACSADFAGMGIARQSWSEETKTKTNVTNNFENDNENKNKKQ
jgi:hypothetical protein